jgi:carbon storage regulator
MLSLSRRQGESIVIGNEISVTVHSVKGNRVRLAVAAPMDVPIRRSELIIDSAQLIPIAEQPDSTENCLIEVGAASG